MERDDDRHARGQASAPDAGRSDDAAIPASVLRKARARVRKWRAPTATEDATKPEPAPHEARWQGGWSGALTWESWR